MEKIIGADRVKNEVLSTVKEAEKKKILQTIKRKKANYTGYILHRNCFLKYVTEGKKGYKGREDEKEEVSRYWATLNKREDTGI